MPGKDVEIIIGKSKIPPYSSLGCLAPPLRRIPYRRNAELTQWALHINDYSEVKTEPAKVFDRNHSGRISLAELGDVLAGIGHVKTTEVRTSRSWAESAGGY